MRILQIALPDDVAHTLETKWGSLERKLLETIAIAAYQEGSISAGKVRELLSMATRLEVDAFLQEKGVYLHYDEADFAEDRSAHQQLRQSGKLK
ncbi:UPF0175 family protein [Aliterella atlantica]|uniref:Uncharacterized protein n=1 Tax=Aliterella atlantica CENA595 TaxID=1618023 RepID=A0A0D8ZVI2_9CYAN|nr:UPF0175 family protein [Aliterella atlantica]KJH72740.1 hypothetical protein UH38_04020 [Aliterella atlantica CENA595]